MHKLNTYSDLNVTTVLVSECSCIECSEKDLLIYVASNISSQAVHKSQLIDDLFATGSCSCEDAEYSTLVARPPSTVTAVECTGEERFSLGVFGWKEVECNGKPISAYFFEMKDHQGSTDDWKSVPWPQNFVTHTLGAGAMLGPTVSKLQAETEYDFRVRAVNKVGVGEWSPVTTFKTLPAVPPSGVSDAFNLMALESGSTMTAVEVAWVPVEVCSVFECMMLID